MKVIIVGGVAGGATAATRLRRLREDAEILVLERGPEVSFANCGLPYYLGGVIEQRDSLLMTNPERLRRRYNLDVRTLSQVEAIDRPQKLVTIRNLVNGELYQESYDKLLLATGAAPRQPTVSGCDLEGVYTLRSMQDCDRIHEALGRARSAVVVGAGFIGLEMVENLHQRNLQVSLVEWCDQLLPPLDRELTTPLLDALQAKGIQVYLNNALAAIEPGLQVRLSDGVQLQADVVILGIGVRPENQLAVQAGLAVGQQGGVRVDGRMQTSDPDIYAVGDLIEVPDFVTGQRVQVPLAGPANRQGRLAADAIAGEADEFRGCQATAVVGLFGWTAAITGLSEKRLKADNLAYDKVYVHPNQHAGYYPGATQMTLKLLYAPPTGRILGAQAVGRAGVEKRIDVISMAIQARMTVFDLEQAELCYAPAYGSAKDPVNMAGFVAAGKIRGVHPQIQASEVSEDHLVLDVREPDEFARGHLPGALNLPLDQLRSRLSELPLKRPIVAYCQVGMRGYLATRILVQKGFDAINLAGGYRTWTQFGLPTAPPP